MYAFQFIPCGKGWSLAWRTPAMSAPAFWQFDTIAEARAAAARIVGLLGEEEGKL